MLFTFRTDFSSADPELSNFFTSPGICFLLSVSWFFCLIWITIISEANVTKEEKPLTTGACLVFGSYYPLFWKLSVFFDWIESQKSSFLLHFKNVYFSVTRVDLLILVTLLVLKLIWYNVKVFLKVIRMDFNHDLWIKCFG